MKKLIAFLMTLCLLCASCAALADTEIPTWESMPGAVIEDENTTVDEAAFEGEWVMNVAFLGTEYVDEQTLFDTYNFNFKPFRIGDGKIAQDIEDGEGEFRTVETSYTFEAGQLQSQDGSGLNFAIDLLEDGNIVLSVFLPGEGETLDCLSVFMVHPEAQD